MHRHPHDLDLPAWGPYSKRYAGCSHIPDPASGCRLDLSVFPAWDQGRIEVPNVAWDAGYAPWLAAADGGFHAFRHQLLDRDELTVETAWAAAGDGIDGRVVRIRMANRSDRRQSLCCHLVAGCQYPSPRPTGHSAPQVARPALLMLPGGGAWTDARDSAAHRPGRRDSREHLVADGWAWHEQLEDGCVGGGYRWFAGGDAARYAIAAGDLADGRLWLRVRAPEGAGRLTVAGAEVAVASPAWTWLALPWHPVAELEVAHAGGGRIDCDVLAVAPAGAAPQLADRRWRPEPAITGGPGGRGLLVAWPDLPTSYGLWWGDQSFIRQWWSESLDEPMRRGAHDHVSPRKHGAGDGHWLTVRLGQFHLAPGEERDAWALVCAGPSQAVSEAVARVEPDSLRTWHDAAAARAWRPRTPDDAGRAAQLMAATLATNIVYPVYTRRGYVRHHTPGKTWDSLYTWDSGFIALGLAELDPARAAGCIAQYLMPEGDPCCAWLHHGSPVPVQIHAMREVWNRTRDRALAARLYPGLRQMHRFLAGRHPGSDTLRPGSGLLATWTHFYNSGGWDDYPAQMRVHAEGLAAGVAPMVTASQVIACARILRRLAVLAGHPGDAAEYDGDIARLAAAVQAHGWDGAEGWFGYVRHDAEGRPCGLLRGPDGVNANRGLDGCYPLVTGICDADQERRLLGHLADPRELWTPLGFSTVDQSAPYYRSDGYWNGAVWLPHCWFFWKALLGLGAGDLAWRLVSSALAAWSAEFAATGRTWEKMIIATGRGAGWHHFGGLSSPLLAWYEALHRPGRLTGGQDLWIEDESWDGRSYRARIVADGPAQRTAAAWLCLPAASVRAAWDGRAVAAIRRSDRVWELAVPAQGAGELVVTAG